MMAFVSKNPGNVWIMHAENDCLDCLYRKQKKLIQIGYLRNCTDAWGLIYLLILSGFQQDLKFLLL